MDANIIYVKNYVIQDELKYNGETVVTYKIEYPQFCWSNYKKSLNTINKFYYNKAKEFQRFYTKELYKPAVEQYIYSIENGFPVRVYEGLAVYQITYNMACIISLFYDNYIYLGGAHGSTIRTSETWNLQKNSMIKLGELMECPTDYKGFILKAINDEIKKDTSIYFDDYEELAEKNFNSNNFYCIPKGIVIYYQQYDIAPYSSGIREFLILYNDCVINPYKKCLFLCD
ncbi:DUF3298 and DUF4163 domain-containing protein [Aminipila terrae]|uniref:DUF4163 domain-containing protein n=1 Tax=Aminipila terrae TaxID=2697030 RepID=A0A6P1MN82_9FIRM|nr:DUF3298 and DUF4163 domain-containing protein [Aminipila terrae]QHI73558.1 DUF4163 domain-containing protein [Aminipila terrae]